MFNSRGKNKPKRQKYKIHYDKINDPQLRALMKITLAIALKANCIPESIIFPPDILPSIIDTLGETEIFELTEEN